MFINTDAPKALSSKYIKQKLTELKREISQQFSWRFNNGFSIMDKTTRQMINENIEDLNNIVKQLGLGDTYWPQHLTEKTNKQKKIILLLYTGDTEKHKTVWKKLKYFKINRQPVFINHKTELY